MEHADETWIRLQKSIQRADPEVLRCRIVFPDGDLLKFLGIRRNNPRVYSSYGFRHLAIDQSVLTDQNQLESKFTHLVWLVLPLLLLPGVPRP